MLVLKIYIHKIPHQSHNYAGLQDCGTTITSAATTHNGTEFYTGIKGGQVTGWRSVHRVSSSALTLLVGCRKDSRPQAAYRKQTCSTYPQKYRKKTERQMAKSDSLRNRTLKIDSMKSTGIPQNLLVDKE